MREPLLHRLSLTTGAVLAAFFAFGVVASIGQGPNIDQRPLRDFAADVQAKIDRKEVDIRKPFSVEMAAVITADGRLDRNASIFTNTSGDPKMVKVAENAIEAMGDSGYFAYLQQAGISRANLLITQNNATFTGSVRASENRFKAAMITSGVNAFISMGLSQQMDPDQRLVLQNTHATHDAGNIDIICTLPAADFQRMILNGRAATAGPSN